MKLPQVMDSEDVGIIAKGIILVALAIGGILALALALGLAWTVFRLAGGL